MKKLKEIIFRLENRLLQPDVRKSVIQLNEMISEDFIEIGSSGQIYTKKNVLKNLPSSPKIKFIVTDFRIVILSPNIIQSIFKTEKINQVTNKTTFSLRSSIWKNEDSKWRMIFHQGTPL